jgi:hypothetical protein
VTIAVTENTISGRISTVSGDGVSEASTAVNRMSAGPTVRFLQYKDADLLCIPCI